MKRLNGSLSFFFYPQTIPAFLPRTFLFISMEPACILIFITFLFSSPEPACSHLQNLPVLISRISCIFIFVTFLFSSPEHSCSHLQNLPVLISRTFLFSSPESSCSHLQNLPVPSPDPSVLISRIFLFSSPEPSNIYSSQNIFLSSFLYSMTFSLFEPRLVPSPSILYIYISLTARFPVIDQTILYIR